jgi:hypothetical protein
MLNEPVKTGRKQDGRYKIGFSGNKSGRPKGSLNVSTKMAMTLLEEGCEDIVKQVISLAKNGDIAAIKLVLERLIPVKKELPINVAINTINNASDCMVANSQILESVSLGEITLSEGQSLMAMTENMRKSIDSHEFELRMNEIERKLESK